MLNIIIISTLALVSIASPSTASENTIKPLIVAGTPNVRFIAGTPNVRFIAGAPNVRFIAGTPNVRFIAGLPDVRLIT